MFHFTCDTSKFYKRSAKHFIIIITSSIKKIKKKKKKKKKKTYKNFILQIMSKSYQKYFRIIDLWSVSMIQE